MPPLAEADAAAGVKAPTISHAGTWEREQDGAKRVLFHCEDNAFGFQLPQGLMSYIFQTETFHDPWRLQGALD